MARRRAAKPPSRGRAPTEADLLAFYARNRDTLDAKVDGDIDRSCTSKDAYPTQGHARAVAAMNGMADALHSYECFYCKSWHLTRRPPAQGPTIIDE